MLYLYHCAMYITNLREISEYMVIKYADNIKKWEASLWEDANSLRLNTTQIISMWYSYVSIYEAKLHKAGCTHSCEVMKQLIWKYKKHKDPWTKHKVVVELSASGSIWEGNGQVKCGLFISSLTLWFQPAPYALKQLIYFGLDYWRINVNQYIRIFLCSFLNYVIHLKSHVQSAALDMLHIGIVHSNQFQNQISKAICNASNISSVSSMQYK